LRKSRYLRFPQPHMKPFPARLKILALSALAGFCAHAAELETTTPVAAKTNGEKWWNGNCERILADIRKMEGEIDVAFVGDSITARWRGCESWTKHWGSCRAVNMGIGGDRTQNVLWRLQNGGLDGYKAKLFVVMIGTNNLWDKKAEPADVAAGVKAILDLIQAKQPQARILLMSILPAGEKPNPGREKRSAVNGLISKFAGGSVEYMDISAKYLEADGTISKEVMHDFLHLAPKGYDIWAEAISGKVREIAGGR
jgi:lysophospholipase L1-like esterase